MPALNALHHDHVKAAGGARALGARFGVLGGGVERPGDGEIGEFQHHQSARRPAAFEDGDFPAPGQEFAAVLAAAAGDSAV